MNMTPAHGVDTGFASPAPGGRLRALLRVRGVALFTQRLPDGLLMRHFRIRIGRFDLRVVLFS